MPSRKARRLTGEEITTLVARPHVRRIAVENFMSSVDCSIDLGFNVMNLVNDSAAYRWNRATVQAIKDGLELMYGESA